MTRRAHNSKYPRSIAFQDDKFDGPTNLYEAAKPDPLISLKTFQTRLRRLAARQELCEQKIHDALYLDADQYRKKYSVRKTIVWVKGEQFVLENYYRDHKDDAIVESFAKKRPPHGGPQSD